MKVVTFKELFDTKFGVGEQNIDGEDIVVCVMPYSDIKSEMSSLIKTPYMLSPNESREGTRVIIIPQEYLRINSYEGMMFIIYHLVYRCIKLPGESVQYANNNDILQVSDEYAYKMLMTEGISPLHAFSDACNATVDGLCQILGKIQGRRRVKNFKADAKVRKDYLERYDRVHKLYPSPR